MARKASEDLKEVTHALRPYHLDKIGLSATIEGMVRQVGEACAIEFTTDMDGLDELRDPEGQIDAYRIVQESISNVVKHSGATRARVTARRLERSIELRVTDNGKGFRSQAIEAETPAGGGLGLMGIRERARAMGGTADVQFAPGAGTSIVVTVPLDGRDHGR